ncbi:MAG: hypothetical protein DWQ06_10055 [Calditrichaeota bacterium]|nr:MAG: hypothetical protein DWQ06_10055 [Calditrichota bacterium]
MLIGGYAVGYYGYPRATNNIDFWVEINPKNAKKISKTFIEFGLPKEEVADSLFLEANIVRMGFPPIRIEILTEISGIEFAKCYQESKIIELDKTKVRIISLKDLKKNKKASGRYKDLDDLENLP